MRTVCVFRKKVKLPCGREGVASLRSGYGCKGNDISYVNRGALISIDILKIDLLSGKGAIYKSGAAPSFLRRGRDVFPIESEGFPIGILKQTNATRTDLVLAERTSVRIE